VPPGCAYGTVKKVHAQIESHDAILASWLTAGAQL